LDHDPLYEFVRWQANLRILGIETVQTVPLVPWSHPVVERPVRSIRIEYLDQLFYWNGQDLEAKLDLFKSHFNVARVHQGLGGDTPAKKGGAQRRRWQSHCHGLVQLPTAA
jgi:hypothetical protein